MSSEQPTDEMAALRKKILSLEVKMKMQRVNRDNREAWEKRDREAAIENERRDRLLENERRDRLLENERRDRKDLEQKRRGVQTVHPVSTSVSFPSRPPCPVVLAPFPPPLLRLAPRS
jgi:hypothetical protein